MSRTGVAVLAMTIGLTATAYAATAPTVEVAITAQKEVVKVDPHGKKAVTLVPASEGHTGDVIVYTLRASNKGTGTAVDPRIEDPIPAGTTLVLDSVKQDGYRIEASLDNGSTWQSFPAQVTRKNAAGATETVAAPAESYTALRWVLNGPLQPGDGKDVSFKVQIR
jgi:uncharacterized repeat protein (TIGR01451 family)